MSAEKPFHHGNLRNALLEGVRELVEANGPDGVTLAAAARHAGVSAAAPYKHFRDRSDLMRTAVCEGMERLRVRMADAYARHPPATLEAIAAIGVAYIAFARAEPGMFRLIFSLTETHEQTPELTERGRETFAVVLNATAAYLGKAPDEEVTGHSAYQLWAAVHGHSFLVLDCKVSGAAQTLTDDVFAFAIARGVLGAR